MNKLWMVRTFTVVAAIVPGIAWASSPAAHPISGPGPGANTTAQTKMGTTGTGAMGLTGLAYRYKGRNYQAVVFASGPTNTLGGSPARIPGLHWTGVLLPGKKLVFVPSNGIKEGKHLRLHEQKPAAIPGPWGHADLPKKHIPGPSGIGA